MWQNQRKPANMAVLLNAPRAGMRNFEAPPTERAARNAANPRFWSIVMFPAYPGQATVMARVFPHWRPRLGTSMPRSQRLF